MTSALKLRFLATGGNQHVFVDEASGDGDWVYKVPAHFGHLLPWDHPRRLARKRPRTRLKRAVHGLLFAQPPAQHATAPASVPRTTRERVWAEYLRHNAERRFRRMLRLMEVLSERKQADVLMPYRVQRDRTVTLHVGDRALPYRGPVLVQRRACFRKVPEIIDHGDWDALVAAQHRLWRQGLAVADVVRYTSWVLLDGRLCLADADSLTDSLGVARTYVTARVMDDEVGIIGRALAGVQTVRARQEYLSHIFAGVNRETLDRLWLADVRGS
jgi:hypothetical protein